MDIKKQEAALLRLPPKKRALLAEHLIASLDELSSSEREKLWVEEAERRFQVYKKGAMSSSPSSTVFKSAFRKIA